MGKRPCKTKKIYYYYSCPNCKKTFRADVLEKEITTILEKLSKIQGVEAVPTFFALSPQGYEKMSGNLQEMRRYILEQKEIIVYYKKVTTPEEPTKVGDGIERPSIGLYPRDKE